MGHTYRERNTTKCPTVILFKENRTTVCFVVFTIAYDMGNCYTKKYFGKSKFVVTDGVLLEVFLYIYFLCSNFTICTQDNVLHIYRGKKDNIVGSSTDREVFISSDLYFKIENRKKAYIYMSLYTCNPRIG